MKPNQGTRLFKLYAILQLLTKRLFSDVRDCSVVSNDGNLEVKTNTNMCPMIRLCIWGVLYVLIASVCLFGIGYTVFYLPLLFGGAVGYFNTYIIPASIIGVLILAVVGINKFIKNKVTESSADKNARHEAGNYTIWETTKTAAESFHDNTCIPVTFVPVTVSVQSPAVISDDKPEAEAEMVEVPVKAGWFIKFLDKYLPPGSMTFIAGGCILMLFLINYSMANILGDDIVVFEKAQCVATFNLEKELGVITCGKFTVFKNDNTYMAQVLVQNKVPVCEVTSHSYTDRETFVCEYKEKGK
jgi:hypothetical protein